VSGVDLIFLAAGGTLAVVLLAILSWLLYTAYLDRVERRLAARKGLYRDLVSQLATRDRALLEPTIHQMSTLYDLDALEAVLEEQARSATGRPAWLLQVYDQLGLVDKYIEKLRTARKWRDRAFAAELLGRVGSAKAVLTLLETVQATQTEDADVREIALRALARIADPHAVEPLVLALAQAEPWLAPRIADILARHGDVVVEPLLALLNDPDRHTARAWAANVLGEIGAQAALPALIRSLDDPDDEVRAKSATALGRLGDRRALQPLLDHLLTDPAPFVRVRIASTVGQFGGPEVVNRLVRTLGDPAWWVRLRGVEALEQVGPSAEGPLVVALGDPDPEIRQRAAVSLERLGVPTALLRRIEQNQGAEEAADTLSRLASAGTRELLTELLLHQSPIVRRAVMKAIRDSRRRDLGPELIRIAGGDPESSLRAMALETIRALRADGSLPVALSGVRDPDLEVRIAAIRLLGESRGGNALDVLREQTADPDPVVRAASITALAAAGPTSAEPELLRLLRDSEPTVRAAAALAAGQSGARGLVQPLAELLSDPEPEVGLAASHSLGALSDPATVPLLLAAWDQASPDLRDSITRAISRLDTASLGDLIDRLIEYDDPESRLALARNLGRVRWHTGVQHLMRLAGDADPAVRTAALQSLGQCDRRTSPPPERLTQTVETALGDPVAPVRAAAIDVCARLGLQDQGRQLIALLQRDPAALVKERAALAIGLLRSPGGEAALTAASRRNEPAGVRAAAILAAGAYDRSSLVGLALEVPEQASVRELLRERIRHDPWYRLLSRRLPRTSDLELRALAAESSAGSQVSLADGLRNVLDPSERVRLIGGLRTFQGEHSRTALLQLVRSDPSPEVRTAALSSIAELLDPDELLSFGSRALGDPSPMVRRAAVSLFGRVPAARAFPRLIQALRLDDETAVLAAVGALAEEQFSDFRDMALALLETSRSVLVTRIARYIHHPDIQTLLSPLSRSAAPEVRESVAEVLGHRPDASEPMALETLSADPVLSVRRIAVGALVAAERYELLDRMRQDPEPEVRREIALKLGSAGPVGPEGLLVLEHLESDSAMAIRAAAHISRLLQGVPLPLPPDLDTRVAADAVRQGAELGALRHVARTAASEDRRLSAGLALALIQDEVAREVARSDPAPSVRHRVAGALELSLASLAGGAP
jgi:HEAT repeat protein